MGTQTHRHTPATPRPPPATHARTRHQRDHTRGLVLLPTPINTPADADAPITMPSVTLRTGNIFDCFPCIKNWELGNDELLHGLDLSLKLWSKSASTPSIVGNHSQNDAAEAALVELGTNQLEQLTLSYHRDCPKELTVA